MVNECEFIDNHSIKKIQKIIRRELFVLNNQLHKQFSESFMFFL